MRKFDFVIYISGPWKTYHRKPLIFKLAERLKASGNKMLLLEPPVTPLHALLMHPQRLWRFLFGKKTKQITDNLFVHLPMMAFHFYLGAIFPLCGKINRSLLRKQLRKILPELEFSENIYLWVFRPECLQYLGTAAEKKVIYDYYDDYLLNSSGREVRRNEIREKKLLQQSDYVFCTTEKLLAQVKKFNASSFLLPNAAEIENFLQVGNADIQEDPEFKYIKHPVIGYHGNVRDWIDFELVEHLLQNTDYTFLFAGAVHRKVRKTIERLKKYENFVATDYLDFKRLPAVIKIFDVEWIPFKMNRFNESVIPYKLFESFASGKPVVAAALPDIEKHWQEWCHIYHNRQEALEQFKTALSNKSKRYPLGNKEARYRLSWDSRVDELFGLLERKSSPLKKGARGL